MRRARTSTKEITRGSDELLASAVHQPTAMDWSMLKRVVRYLGSSPSGWTRIEPTSDFKFDLHLPGRANLTKQSGGWNLAKGDVGKDRPSLNA
eukprot:4302884-Amphidinium_carterae.4